MSAETWNIIIGGLIAGAGGLLAAAIGWIASWHVAKRTIEAERLRGIRQYRRERLLPFQQRVDQRLGPYNKLLVACGARNQVEVAQYLTVIQRGNSVWDDTAWMTVRNQAFQAAAQAFVRADGELRGKILRQLTDQALSWDERFARVGSLLPREAGQLQDLGSKVSEAAERYIFEANIRDG